MPEHVLVLRPGAIGDTLVTLPALLALRRRFPQASLRLAGNPAVLPLLEASGIVDEWLSFDSPRVTRLYGGGGSRDDDPFLVSDVVVAWCVDPDGLLLQGLEQRGARQMLITPSRPPAGRTVHVARHLLETLAPLGVEAGATLELPKITPPLDAVTQAHAELAALGLAGQPFVAVHPGSGSRSKNWPPEQYAAIIDALAQQHALPCLILAGPADDDVLTRLTKQLHALQSGRVQSPLTSLPRAPLAVLAGRPLTVVAAVLQQARAFLGNDSGLAHLAGQLGLPTLALFGPMDPAIWSPLGPRVQTLRAEPLADLPAETVLSALLPAL